MNPNGDASVPRWLAHPWLSPALVGLIALVVRLIHVLDLRRVILFDAPIMDAQVHDGWARGTITMFFENTPYFRAPLYPWFLELVYLVDPGYLAPRIAQAALSALTVVLMADIGRRLSGPVAAIAGGLLLAFCWPVIYFSGELLIVTFFMALMGLALWLFVVAEVKDRIWVALAGALCLGLAACARPTALVLLPALVALPLWAWRSDSLVQLRRRPLLLAVGLVGLSLLPGLGLTVRNLVVGDDAVFIASQGGVNFYIGNNPQSDGRTAVVPGTSPTWLGGYVDTMENAVADEGRPLKASGVSRYYFGKGLRYLIEEPGDAARLYLRKARLLFGAAERSNNKNIHFWREQTTFLSGPFFVSWSAMFGFGVVGLFLVPRWRRRAFVVWSFLLLYALGLLLFFVNERFRTPLTIVLASTAGVPVWNAWLAMRSREWVRLGAIVMAVAGLIVVSELDRLDFKGDRTDADAYSRYTLGNAYQQAGRPHEAIQAYSDALAVGRKFRLRGFDQVEPLIHLNLTRALYRVRNYDAMEDQLEMLDLTRAEDPAVLTLWGHFHRSQYHWVRAFELYRGVLADNPEYLDAVLGLAWCQMNNEGYQTARQNFQRVLAKDPQNAEALAGLAGAELMGRKNEGKAWDLLHRALEIEPETAAAHLYLSDIYRTRGDGPNLVYHAREALRLDPRNMRIRRFLTRAKIPLEHPEGEAPRP